MIAPTIRVEQLVYHYEESIPALNGVDLEIGSNAFLAIVGQNGSGKTTLVKHFNGLLKPTSGRVYIGELETSRASVGELARTVGYVFQNPDHQIFCPTVREEIAFGPRNLGLGSDEIAHRVEEALQLFGLGYHANLPPAVLGFGLRRKVSIAAVYAMHPRILILDEPVAGLDARSARELLALVGELHAKGHTIIVVTHNMRLVAEYAEQTLVMQDGRVLAYGPTRQVLCRIEALHRAKIAPPQVTQLGRRLAEQGFGDDILTVDEFCGEYGRIRGGGR